MYVTKNETCGICDDVNKLYMGHRIIYKMENIKTKVQETSK